MAADAFAIYILTAIPEFYEFTTSVFCLLSLGLRKSSTRLKFVFSLHT